MDQFKDKLNAAFSAMRRTGLVARQNFSCCGSCAGYDIASDVTAMTEAKRDKVLGCAFYTRQEWARFNERGSRCEGIYIAYGQVGTQAHGDVGLSTAAVGQLVATCLKNAGLEVEWDGNPDKKIYIKA